MERTLSIIKPDGVEKNIIGKIYSRFEKAGLRIVEAKMLHLSQEQAEGFYAVHKERPFFVHGIKSFCLFLAQMQHLCLNDSKTCFFKTRINLAYDILFYTVWFNDR